MVWRHNDWAKSFVARISRGMKLRKKFAIVALARKLLVILWAILRENKPWRHTRCVMNQRPRLTRCVTALPQ
ncbi:MAG TPA: hypothetical protein VGR35_20380 [Tepidisphaeraceae bacterium]|nr:hypothetical protein [Tepidisphaeraceae bacterium]